MFVLIVYQNIYLAKTNIEDIPEDWGRNIKISYIIGLCGPILNWIFIFFLISRLNERIRNVTNPGFLDTKDDEDFDDNDKKAMINHSGELGPVVFDDMRQDYRRPASPVQSPTEAINSGF